MEFQGTRREANSQGKVTFSLVHWLHAEGEHGCTYQGGKHGAEWLNELAQELEFSSWILASPPSSSVTQGKLVNLNSTLSLVT